MGANASSGRKRTQALGLRGIDKAPSGGEREEMCFLLGTRCANRKCLGALCRVTWPATCTGCVLEESLSQEQVLDMILPRAIDSPMHPAETDGCGVTTPAGDVADLGARAGWVSGGHTRC